MMSLNRNANTDYGKQNICQLFCDNPYITGRESTLIYMVLVLTSTTQAFGCTCYGA